MIPLPAIAAGVVAVVKLAKLFNKKKDIFDKVKEDTKNINIKKK